MLKELRTFVAVGRHGSFSRTGERIGLTQSAISAQMQRLESQLGFALFDRIGRSVKLNTAGRETLARAEQLIALFEGLHQPAGSMVQTLRIGAIASVQAAGLPDALVSLRRSHPQARWRIVPGVSLNLLGLVDGGELDAAVMIRPPFALPPELAWRPLWSEPFVLAVPARVKGRDWRALLEAEPFIRYDRHSFGGRVVAQFLDAQGIAVDDAVEMDEIGGLVQLVARGLGVALLPRCRPYLPWPAGVRTIGLGEGGIEREIGLVERVRHAQLPVIRELAEALKKAPH